ncbi:hypothetical protein FQN50_006237 [Emmonsiellopsis sp. PD_5]|nr:hypothetical protein FQN50_006237 [Emmonsiellopsis sp. PD_5]
MPSPQWGRLSSVTSSNTLYTRNRSRSLESERPPTRRSKLRRVVSTRAFSQYIDSSESIPSEHSSLYDAVLASFESDESRQQIQADVAAAERSLNNSSTRAGNDPTSTLTPARAYSRNKWPAHRLETIVEQRSVSTLKPPSSTAGVDGSGDASRGSTSSPARQKNLYGTKVYSFDDLDLPPSRPKPSSRLPNRSSSSGASFELRCLLNPSSPVEPTQPIYPPPVRSPTPPGLPSFGSREAIQYNNRQAQRGRSLHNQTPLSRRVTQRSSPVDNDDEGDDDDSCCASGLKRLFGLPSCSTSRTPALPAGSVARADDGTIVRGRFGARQSGHGVGAGPNSRGLESHPFHRNTLPAARVKETGGFNQNLSDTGPRVDHRDRQIPSQHAYSSPQSMPQSYSSLLRAQNRPYPVPHRRTCPNSNTTTEAITTVPLPISVAHRRLEPALPQFPEMIRNPQNDNRIPPGPDGGGNDGSSSTPMRRPVRSSTGNGRQRKNRPSRQTTMIEDNKAPGLCEWLFMDCFFVCCGLFGGHDTPRARTTISFRIGNSAMDGPSPTQDAPARASGRSNPSGSNQDGICPRERSVSNPWTPAWGWQPRCFGGDSTMDDDAHLETATELRPISSSAGRELDVQGRA